MNTLNWGSVFSYLCADIELCLRVASLSHGFDLVSLRLKVPASHFGDAKYLQGSLGSQHEIMFLQGSFRSP